MSAARGIRNGVLLAAPAWAVIALAALHACGASGQSALERRAVPAQYIAPTVARVTVLPLNEVRVSCIAQGVPAHLDPRACAFVREGECHVTLPYARQAGYETAGWLIEWEMARCWGWSP